MFICPTCHKANVAKRYGKTGTYLANVETYPNGRSYFRSLHTADECNAYMVSVVTQADKDDARERSLNAKEAWLDAVGAWQTNGSVGPMPVRPV